MNSRFKRQRSEYKLSYCNPPNTLLLRNSNLAKTASTPNNMGTEGINENLGQSGYT